MCVRKRADARAGARARRHSYVEPIVAADNDVLPTVTKRELTAALPEIVKVHQMLRDELTTLLADWDDSRSQVGPLFVRFSPFFKLYNSYCANYNSSRQSSSVTKIITIFLHPPQIAVSTMEVFTS